MPIQLNQELFHLILSSMYFSGHFSVDEMVSFPKATGEIEVLRLKVWKETKTTDLNENAFDHSSTNFENNQTTNVSCTYNGADDIMDPFSGLTLFGNEEILQLENLN